MRKPVLRMSMSLDGFVSGPNGESDWIFRTGGEDARGLGSGRDAAGGAAWDGQPIFPRHGGLLADLGQ